MFVNKLVNARTGEERGPTHRLWAHGSTGYVWQPEANCPVFDEFLESVFPDDDDAKRLVEEWLGYNMTEDVWAQKGMTLIGEPRAGKGLIIHMMEGLVGSRNFVALDLDSWQKNGFSTQCMLGKRAGAFPDVRMKPGQYYGNEWVPGGLDHKARELLLKITGGDHLTIEKKWKTEAWEGVLPLKLTLVSNEIPNFNEDILASRFLKLHFKRSFLGKEDVNLKDKLLAELPGIAARCLAAYGRLRERGRFVQPASGLAVERELAKKRHPHIAMVLDCFVPVPDISESVVKSDAHKCCQAWLRDNGHGVLAALLRAEEMKRMLLGAPGFGHLSDIPRPHGQPRVWHGMRLSAEGERLLDEV